MLAGRGARVRTGRPSSRDPSHDARPNRETDPGNTRAAPAVQGPPMPPTTSADRREQGAALVLTMLVLMVILVVVFQTDVLSHAERDQAAYYVSNAQMYYLAEACAMQAGSVLLMDVEEKQSGGEDGGGGLGVGADGGLGFGGGDDGGGEGEDGGTSAAQVTMDTDSYLDEWMNPAALAPPLGEGFTLYVEVRDEDSKINMLGLWTEDEEKREEWREVFERLLDKAFEGTSFDFSAIDATDVIDELDDWVKGQRGRFRETPLPPLKTSRAEDEAKKDSKLDTDIIENEERHFPLTIPELELIPGVEREHVWGFVEDDEYHPGLMEYLTVWSELELKDPPAEEDGEFEDSPFAGSVFDDEMNEDDVEEPEDAEISANPTANGRVNANTASLVVLRALAPEEIPNAFLDRVIEFRERIHELRDEWEDTLGDLGAQGAGSVFGDRPEGQDEDEENDPAHYVFQTEDEVFDKVEAEWELSVFSDDEQRSKFTERLGVLSNVFTIKILIQEPESGRRATYRTVVWRMESDGEDPRIITLLPLEPYEDTRRPQDYPEDLQERTDRRFERPDGSRYDLG